MTCGKSFFVLFFFCNAKTWGGGSTFSGEADSLFSGNSFFLGKSLYGRDIVCDLYNFFFLEDFVSFVSFISLIFLFIFSKEFFSDGCNFSGNFSEDDIIFFGVIFSIVFSFFKSFSFFSI